MLLFLKSFFRAKMWKPKKTIKDKFVILDAFLTQLKDMDCKSLIALLTKSLNSLTNLPDLSHCLHPLFGPY